MLGKQTVMTRAVSDAIAESLEFAQFVVDSVNRFANEDFGDTNPEDNELNLSAVKAWKENDQDRMDRVLAVYKGLETIWIITEWDRSVTTIMFPSDY